MGDAITGTLRVLHIVSGVTWIGGGLLWNTLVAPSVLKNGPPQIRRPFLEATLHKLTRMMIGSGFATIIFGILLLGQMVGWDSFFAIFQNGGTYGTMLGAGAVLAILTLAEGLIFIKPTGEKLLATMQSVPAGQPPSAETQAKLAGLGKKIGIAGMVNILLGVLALVCMILAVNSVR
jgi:hypothetical protein